MKRPRGAALALILVLSALVAAYILTTLAHTQNAHEISVILPACEDGIWDAALQGMELAAKETNASLNIIMHDGENVAEEHETVVRREIGNGVSAVVMIPCGEEASVSNSIRNTVMVQIEGSASGDLPAIMPDNEALGRELARIARRDGALGTGGVYVLSPASANKAVVCRLEGLLSELESYGVVYENVEISAITDATQDGCVLAVDASTLLQCGDYLNDSSRKDIALYGIGMIGQTGALLENGSIRSILATDQYRMGYLAVEAAVEIIEGRRPRKGGGETLLYVEVTAETLFDKENLYLLYPYVR